MTDARPGAAAVPADDADLSSLTYEQLVERLEGLVERMAAGDIGIEQVVELYERAGRLQAAAEERLELVRRRIEALAPPDSDAAG